jgi:hypothetical protein
MRPLIAPITAVPAAATIPWAAEHRINRIHKPAAPPPGSRVLVNKELTRSEARDLAEIGQKVQMLAAQDATAGSPADPGGREDPPEDPAISVELIEAPPES